MQSILVMIYYFFPVCVLTLLLWFASKFLLKWKFRMMLITLLQIAVCFAGVFFVFVLWIWLDGMQNNFSGTEVKSYFFKELKRYWVTPTYFAISIPLLLNLIVRRNSAINKAD